MSVPGEPRPRPRGEPGSLRAVVLAIAVHAAFFALIVFGVSWQSRPTAPVEVEIWDKLAPAKPSPPVDVPKDIKVDDAPPRPLELKKAPAIEKKPEEAKPAPPKPDAEIAEKAERQKREREKREREKAAEKQKAAEAKKRQEEEARKKTEAEKKRREEEAARQEAERVRAAAEARQRAEIDRFVDAIKAKIRGRANVPDTVRGNPEVHVLIHLLPGGEVLDIRITKRSGNPAYDSAIERGIRSASPLPVPPANSELFPRFRELNLQIRHER